MPTALEVRPAYTVMMMIIKKLMACLMILTLVLPASVRAADLSVSNVRVRIWLGGGRRITGETKRRPFPIRSDRGIREVDLAWIHRGEKKHGAKELVFTLRDKTQVLGRPDLETLALRTSIGDVTVPLESMQGMHVIPEGITNGLVLWNRLDGSPSVVGPDIELLSPAEYVPGMFGKALHVGTNGTWAFRVPASVLKGIETRGTIEYWIRARNYKRKVVEKGDPFRFLGGAVKHEYFPDDGAGHSGYRLRMGRHEAEHREKSNSVRKRGRLPDLYLWGHHSISWDRTGLYPEFQGKTLRIAFSKTGMFRGKYDEPVRHWAPFDFSGPDGDYLYFIGSREVLGEAVCVDEVKIRNWPLLDHGQIQKHALPERTWGDHAPRFRLEFRRGAPLEGSFEEPCISFCSDPMGVVTIPLDKIETMGFGKEPPVRVAARLHDGDCVGNGILLKTPLIFTTTTGRKLDLAKWHNVGALKAKRAPYSVNPRTHPRPGESTMVYARSLSDARNTFIAAQALLTAGKYDEGRDKAIQAISMATNVADYVNAFYYAWQLASTKGATWTCEQRENWYGQAERCVERVRSAYNWRFAILPNYLQMLCEKETMYAKQGRIGMAFQAYSRAEKLYAEMQDRIHPYDKTPELPVGKWPPRRLAGYCVNLLLDRAAHQGYAGRLRSSKKTFRECLIIADEGLQKPEYREHAMCRTYGNFACALDALGEEDQARSMLEKALAFRNVQHARTVVEISDLRRRSQVEGPTPGIIAALKDKIAALADAGQQATALQARRRLASVLHNAGQTDAAEKEFTNVIHEAKEGDYRETVAHAYLWRGKARTHARPKDAEGDLLNALVYYRKQGIKPREFDVYRAYARLLCQQGRAGEGLIIVAEALRLNRLMEAHPLRPELMAIRAQLLRKGGMNAEADKTWAEALRLLETVRHASKAQRFKVLAMFACDLATCAKPEALADFMAKLRGEVDQAELSDYQRRKFLDFELPEPGKSKETTRDPLLCVDLQPKYISTRSFPGRKAKAWAWLMNPAAVHQLGELSIAGVRGVEIRDAGASALNAMVGAAPGNGGSVMTNLSLAPGGMMAIGLVHSDPPVGKPEHIDLRWAGEEKLECQWHVSADANELGMRANVNASLLLKNPFFNIPVYHEIVAVGTNRLVSANFRFKSSSPCRVEIYNADGSRLLAADADGNASYDEQGDVLCHDADGNGFPDVTTGQPVLAYLSVYPDVGYGGFIDLTLEVLMAGKWTPCGSNRLLLRAGGN